MFLKLIPFNQVEINSQTNTITLTQAPISQFGNYYNEPYWIPITLLLTDSLSSITTYYETELTTFTAIDQLDPGISHLFFNFNFNFVVCYNVANF
jgi:hypothetical protein